MNVQQVDGNVLKLASEDELLPKEDQNPNTHIQKLEGSVLQLAMQDKLLPKEEDSAPASPTVSSQDQSVK